MPLKLYRRGQIWHYRGTVAGGRLRGSTGTSQKDIAQRFIAEKERTQWKGHFDGPEAVLTFAQAAMLYRKAEKSTRFLDKVEDYWKDTPVRSINAGTVKAAAIALHPGGTGATRNRHVVVPTQSIINHAAKRGLCSRLIVERFPHEKKRKEPATWEWVQAFMAVASPHMGALCCFMFLTGARVSEAIDLRWRDVSLQEARALIRETKVGKQRRPHLPPTLVAALANIAGDRAPDKKVFGYSSRDTAKFIWRAAIKRAGIKPLTFHCCRHGFATSLLRAGVDVITIAKLGGWATPEHVFRTYGHASDDDTLANRIIDPRMTQVDSGSQKRYNKQ